MSVFIPATGIESTRALNESALPNAPVEPLEPARPRRLRRMVSALRWRRRRDRDQLGRAPSPALSV